MVNMRTALLAAAASVLGLLIGGTANALPLGAPVAEVAKTGSVEMFHTVQNRRRTPGGRARRNRNNALGAAAAVGVGAALLGAIAGSNAQNRAPRRGYNRGGAPRGGYYQGRPRGGYYQGRPRRTYGGGYNPRPRYRSRRSARNCYRFRSYNPNTGYYRDYNGNYIRCP